MVGNLGGGRKAGINQVLQDFVGEYDKVSKKGRVGAKWKCVTGGRGQGFPVGERA